MIDWSTVAPGLAALTACPTDVAEAAKAAISAAPCFQNTAYPLSPLPLYAAGPATAAMVPALQDYVALLNRIVKLYHEDESLRHWYSLGPAADAMIAADRRLGDVVPVCRLDGYLEQGTERLRLLENNADAPAGTLFSPRVNAIVSDMLDRLRAPAPARSPLTFSDETALLDVLVGCLRSAGLPAGDPRVAVLQFDGRANRESAELVRALNAIGVRAVLADPRAIRVVGDAVWFGADRADVCWNKVNTVSWRTEIEPDADLVDRWVAALSDAAFVHVNPFGARYVAESKLTLALPRDPRFAGHFTERQHALVDTLLPWARRLGNGAFAEGDEVPLRDDVLNRQGDYVIKQPYDIRGDGVTVGRAVTRAQWELAVDHAVHESLVAQRYVTPTAYPVVRAGDRPGVVAMPVSFDTFVFDGSVRGFGSKASTNARLNVFQGGQKLAVHVVPEAS